MTESPDGYGSLTPLGRFIGSLPVSVCAGLIISYGIILGKETSALLCFALICFALILVDFVFFLF